MPTWRWGPISEVRVTFGTAHDSWPTFPEHLTNARLKAGCEGPWGVRGPSRQAHADSSPVAVHVDGSLGTPAGAAPFTGGTWRKDTTTTITSGSAQALEVKDSREAWPSVSSKAIRNANKPHNHCTQVSSSLPASQTTCYEIRGDLFFN